MTWKCKICQNRDFIAFMAHWGFSFFLMTVAAHYQIPLIKAALVIAALAAVKELWDIKYETNHPFWPVSIVDFTGYFFGIMLGLWI
jgi:drug/metabolite transporter (DMT)-like permease